MIKLILIYIKQIGRQKQIIKYKDQLLLHYIQKNEDQLQMPMYTISYYIYISILCFLFIFIFKTQCLLKSISISLNQTSINQLLTHSWTLVYDTTANRSSFSLGFPACVTISSLTSISVAGNSVTVTGYSPTTINFTLGTSIANSKYIFSVSNVKNCFYSGSFKTYSVYNNFENLNQTLSSMTNVIYTPGAIKNCQLVYDGYTGDISSSVEVKFGIKNNVTGTNFTVRFDYRTYSSSSYSITSYNSLSSNPNFVAYCSLLVNDVQKYSAIPAFINFNEMFISCSFTINASNIITDQDIVSLKITNITNPKTIDSYGEETDFTIKTIDNNGFTYDRSLSCALSTVKLATYPSLFSQAQFINDNMYPLQIQSLNPIVLRLSHADKILIKYSLGTFSGCIGSLLVDNSDGQSAITFTQQVTTLNQALLYSASVGSTEFNNTISIQFLGCNLAMPPSSYPIQFTFLFSTLNNQNVRSDYLQLNATLIPKYQIMTQAQVNLSMSVRTIRDTSSYTFSIKIKQPLSESPRITIQFPSQINVTYANATLPTCGITAGIGIGNKQCKLITSNIVQVDFRSNNPLPINTVINITILNVINPQNPSFISGFNIVTYYTSAQPQGIVEMGTNVTVPQSYSARTIYPFINNQNFTVYTAGTLFTVVYQTSVNLNNGSVSTFKFIDNSVKNIQFVSVSSNMYLSPNVASPKFIFNFNTSIPSNCTINFVFRCLTPQKTGTYSILDILTTFNSLEYQKTSSSVTIQIVKPYTNIFAIEPTSNSITGYKTQYAISFTTIVPPTATILQITFPSGTNLLNGLSNCSTGCTITNITDTSSGSLDRIRVFLTPPTPVTDGFFFSLRITSIVNQRYVGQTGNFSFTTLTTLGQLILTGTAVTTIEKPNILIATMQQDDDYYRNNTNIVNIEINVTNMLQSGDYVKITFDSRSYTSNGVVGCLQGNCTFLQSGTILNVTVVLNSLQVMSSVIYLQIYGLISSSTTLYTDKFPINVETYSGQSLTLIDTGVMYYMLDCGNNDTIINKSCRTCATVSGKTNCTSCYTPNYNLINNDYCTNNCGYDSKYQTFPNSGICRSCIAPCFSCQNQTFCINCIPGFYLMMDGSGSCLSDCPTNAGLYVFNLNTFLYCRFCTQPNCISCPNDVCDACDFNWVLSSTFKCTDGCGDGYYVSGGMCNLCDASCVNCFGEGDSGCNACATGYFNINGRCMNKCPGGTVLLTNGVCGCDSVCKTCADTSIKCLQCTSQFEFLYNYTCYSSCPQKTYSEGQICLDCSEGCLICSSTTCMQCINGSYVFENRCYEDCKTLGPIYNNMEIQGVIKCVQCPDGCTQCNSLYQCTACLSGYLLKDQSCKRECQIRNNCNDVAKSDPIRPLPGFITFGISSVILVFLKLTVLKDIYLPYCLLFIGALVSYVQLVVTLTQTKNKINSLAAANSTTRLLAETSQIINQSQGLLALGLGFNYIMNIVFIVLFCKFLKPMIMKRKIEKISNYVVLTFSLLTTYRFYLLCLSRLFKKLCLEVNSHDKLKQLHIFMTVSYIIDLEVFVGGILLIIDSTKQSILQRLGIDLILIIISQWVIFIYVLAVPKSEDYYSLTKKFMYRDNRITEQATIQNEKQESKIKLEDGTDEKLHAEDDKDVQNIGDLPTKQENVVKISPKKSQNIVNQQTINSKTNRKQDQGRMSGSLNENIDANEKNFGSHRSNNQQETQQQTIKNGKNAEIQSGSNSKRMKSNRVQKLKNRNILAEQREQTQFQQNSQELKLQSQVQNQTKIQSVIFEVNHFNKTDTNNKFGKYRKIKLNQRSSTIKIQQSKPMKKKKLFHKVESQIANQSNKDQDYDELDLQAIIQTKIVDRSKDKKVSRDTVAEADKNERGHIGQIGQIYHQEI